MEYNFDVAQMLVTVEEHGKNGRPAFLEHQEHHAAAVLKTRSFPFIKKNDSHRTRDFESWGTTPSLGQGPPRWSKRSHLIILTSVEGLYDRIRANPARSSSKKSRDVSSNLESPRASAKSGQRRMFDQMLAANMRPKRRGRGTIIADGNHRTSDFAEFWKRERRHYALSWPSGRGASPLMIWAQQPFLQVAVPLVVSGRLLVPCDHRKACALQRDDLVSIQGEFSKGTCARLMTSRATSSHVA